MNLRKFLILGLAITSMGLFFGQSVVHAQQNQDEEKVADKYIVVMRSDSDSSDTQKLINASGIQTSEQYSRTIKGFAANISKSKLESIRKNPKVAYIVKDQLVHTDVVRSPKVQTVPTGVKRVGAASTTNKGAGVGVAIIDTGVDLTHPDLSANLATKGKTCVAGTRNANDDNGHGTHVAGIIAAANNNIGVVGVASNARIVPVKVLDRNGSGTWSSVICGIDWVTANAANYGIKVANMSLSGTGISDDNCGLSNNDPLHQAICRSVAAGITYVVAAGNSGADSSNSVPAAYNDAVITVSALADSDGLPGGKGLSTTYGTDDTFASFSNYGAVVDIAAPGVNILSTWKGGGYNTISGTSMASPHVAGAAALYIKSNPSATWQSVKNALTTAGEPNGSGHVDISNLHPEPVLLVGSL